VAVHPDYQRRGIARQMMGASLDMVRRQGGSKAILQVDADNYTAQRLYERLGFSHERAWTTWRRAANATKLPPLAEYPFMTQRRGNEWLAEYHLAERLFPIELGGLGWLRPLHASQFRQPIWKQVSDWLNFRSLERLIIRSEDESEILAALWIENSWMGSAAQLTLMVHPDYEGYYDEALLNTAVRRLGTAQALTIEHPVDRAPTNAILRRYGFAPRREVIHMRWDVR
ncbi:MAG TPA: GNAT family N-acetyltransferase, partial [Phototrophicaceae bacterium]|nr:GNAT family N-acetyltransferase [Phototrophicaceae bacterium]